MTRAALLVVVALGAAGCGPAVPPATASAYARLRVPAAECRAPGPATVTPEAMRADWAELEHILRRGYAGFTVVADEAAWARAFEEGRAAIPNEPIPALAFRDLLVERMRFADDNHFGFWVRGADGQRRWRSTSAHHLAHLSEATFEARDGGWVDAEGRALLTCGDQVRPTWSDGAPSARLVVLSVEPTEAIECRARGPEGEATISYALRPVARDVDRGPAFERREGAAPWLRLRTLGMARRDALDRFVASAEAARDASVVVLDVRGNGGGSDRFLLAWFAALTSQDLSYFDTLRVSSDVELQGALTFWTCEAALAGGDAAGDAWMRERIAQATRALDTAMRERGPYVDRIEGTYTEPGQAPAPFAGRLVLVTDRACGSACETSVLLARQLPGTIVVGENTEGTMKVGELRYYRLPRTGVWTSVGRRAHRDPATGGFPEGIGYAPDVWLDGARVEADVEAIVSCLGDPSCASGLPHSR
ncbi:MAG: hypothetical protein H6719_19465 [Sandaracinaceae bacterium]|nr:hypothetical protein [Sandaracinaceae bacterium]